MNGLMLPKPYVKRSVLGTGSSGQTGGSQGGTSTLPPIQINALNVPSNIYALNVFLNTFLFILVFVSGTMWSTACLEYLKKRPTARGMIIFSCALTLFTCCLAIGFGELSRINNKIQVDYQSDLG